MPPTVSKTAQLVAAVRAWESIRRTDNRLFFDPLARHFLPPMLRLLITLARLPASSVYIRWKNKRTAGSLAGILGRTCFIDECLRESLARGAEQVVILGAGFDSRPYRIQELQQVAVFEVDHPLTQKDKKKRLQQLLGELPAHVTFAAIDFLQQTLVEVLLTAGYAPSKKTFFIWEGVTSYLTAEAVEQTLRFIADNSAEDSEVVFTYLHRGILDNPAQAGIEGIVSLVRKGGEPFTFGLTPEELPEYLRNLGLELVKDVGFEEYSRYIAAGGYDLPISPLFRCALATAKKVAQ